ncbi:MAG: endonuclease [Phycisphaerales bacterium]
MTRTLTGTARGLLVGLASILVAAASSAQPTGYYDTADPSSAAALRASLHDIIDDHIRFPYTSSNTDTWDILELADEDPANSSRIVDVYLNESYPKYGGGNSDYNREHTWPKSYGFPNDHSGNYPYTDCHHLFLCHDSYNTSRSNKPYDFCDASCSEKTTVSTNGSGGGSGVYPGNSNWTTGSGSTGTWETWADRRGDVARALMYMDVRYEGGTHGGSGHSEPDLILTDDRNLIVSNTQSNESVAYMGVLATLVQWHELDPVDDRERIRNDIVYSYQGNRNPFIDHPEWVTILFGGGGGGGGGGGAGQPWINEFHYDNSGGDTGEFVEIAGPAGLDLSGWQVLGYNGSNGSVYKTVNLSGVIPDQQNCMGTLAFTFSSMQNGAPDGLALVDPDDQVVEFISYEGSFTASSGPATGMASTDIGVSESGGTSVGHSLQLSGTGAASADFTWQPPANDTPGAVNNGQTLDGDCGGGGGGGSGPSGDPWINELHYDNSGSDTGEFVEVAGPAGTDLSNWLIVSYNGRNGEWYKSTTLSGVIPDHENGFGAISFAISGLQNGAPDGIALVDPTNGVVQFLSYEGSFVAQDGPASGLASENIGVSESSSTPVGHSLQLAGTGCAYGDFVWQAPANDTPGTPNGSQSFAGGCP